MEAGGLKKESRKGGREGWGRGHTPASASTKNLKNVSGVSQLEAGPTPLSSPAAS